jgi:transposase InsO family protein
MEDGRCKLGLRAKHELVVLIESGESFRAAAAALKVSPATAHRWWHRWQSATAAQRASGECLTARRPIPASCPWALSDEAQRAILHARATTNWGAMRLTWLTGRHRSTICKVLRRHGVSQRRRQPVRQTTKRYEWARAGALLHIDAFSIPKFDHPGHWATGDRSKHGRPGGLGKTVVIGVVDDHTRLAYCELHASENAANVSATLTRAAAWMRDQGCGAVEAVMSDNAKCYAISAVFCDALLRLGARHILTPPYTPRWNGKIERFWHTLDREWAHSREWPNSTIRDRALASWMRFYNRQRPHSAANGRAPITRVH